MIELDLADLMVDGELPVFPEVEEKALLSLRFQRRKAIIAAGGFIGLTLWLIKRAQDRGRKIR